jgi:spore coat polysaccharide biosynthesis predicted glycosyltransferase SpsG
VTKTPALVLLQAENQVRVAEKLDGQSIINLGFDNSVNIIKLSIIKLIKI